MSTHNLANQIDSVKHKLTDKEYKSLMEETSKLNKLIMVKCKLTVFRNTSTVHYDYIRDDCFNDDEDDIQDQHTIHIQNIPKVFDVVKNLPKETYEKIVEDIKNKNYHYLEDTEQQSFVNIRSDINYLDENDDKDDETEVCVVHKKFELCTHIETIDANES